EFRSTTRRAAACEKVTEKSDPACELVLPLADGPPDAGPLIDPEGAHLLALLARGLFELAADDIGLGGLAGLAVAIIVERVHRDYRDEQIAVVEDDGAHVTPRHRHLALDLAGLAGADTGQVALGALAAGGREEGADFLVLLLAGVEHLDVDPEVPRRHWTGIGDLELELDERFGI